MEYLKSYESIKSLSDRIRESASKGKVEKVGGLGSRLKDPAAVIETNFDEVRARYMSFVQDMFQEVPQEERAAEIENYLGPEGDIPRPKRNPTYWKTEPLFAEVSIAETDDNIRTILATLKGHESGGDYSVKNKNGSASGGYQFIDSTWQSLTKKYGIGTEYSSARAAPPEVQDAVAGSYVREILLANNNDVTKVPLVWYTGNAQGTMSDAALKANNGLTAQEYQYKWMRAFNKMTGN